MPTLLRLATVELLEPHFDVNVNVINVEHLARSRGIELVQINEPAPPAGLVGDIIGVRADQTNGESHRVLGTVYADGLPRVLRIDGYAMDMIPEGHMVLIINKDQPGVIGMVGTSFGDAKVNIADMVISREINKDGEATALMVIKTDSEAPFSLLNRLRAARTSSERRAWCSLAEALDLPRGESAAPPGGAGRLGYGGPRRTELYSICSLPLIRVCVPYGIGKSPRRS